MRIKLTALGKELDEEESQFLRVMALGLQILLGCTKKDRIEYTTEASKIVDKIARDRIQQIKGTR